MIREGWLVPTAVCVTIAVTTSTNAQVAGGGPDFSGLVAYLPFNGNAVDESGNGYDGIVHGAQLVPDRFGNPNSAYEFHGSEYIDLTGTDGLDFPTGGFAVCAWVSFVSVDDEAIVVKHNPCGINNGYGLGAGRYAPNALSFMVPGGACGGTDRISTPTSFNDGRWHFAVGTYDGATSRLYVDGEFVTSCSAPYGRRAAGDVLVGAASGGTCAGFHGQIDDVRLYSRAISATEVQELYSAGSDVREGVMESTPQVRLELHPNPATGRMTVSYFVPGTGYAEYAAFDLLGRCARRGSCRAGIGVTTLDVGDMPVGIYRLQISTSPTTGSRLFTVLR